MKRNPLNDGVGRSCVVTLGVWIGYHLGTNLDEWRLFVALDNVLSFRPGPQKYLEEVTAILDVDASAVDPQRASEVAAKYRLEDYGEGKDGVSYALGALGTDLVFVCPNLDLARGFAQHVDTFVYEFGDRDAPNILPLGVGFDLGAAHAFELAYVFGSAERRTKSMAPASRELADAMTAYWATFARNGDPNPDAGSLPPWLPGEQALSLEAPTPQSTTVEAISASHHCDFWNPLRAEGPATP